MSYRVVVTGHTSEGQSTFLRDRRAPETPGWMFNFWGTPTTPADNGRASDDASPGLELSPPLSGSLFRIFHILPDRQLATKTKAELEQISREIGIPGAPNPGERIWHRTDTLDYVVILSGNVTLHLDTGDVHLGPQDVVVQRGTHHAWSNHGETVAVAVCIMVGAKPLGIVSPKAGPDRLALGT
jgi:mannose-6-phosphate isomerase-like protein (cupin superfamily)